jgi:hypothetical protein
LEKKTDLARAERKQNEDLVPPPDSQHQELEIVKEQVIDLNDKFDYLVSLMIKNQKIAVISNAQEEDEFILTNNNLDVKFEGDD